jgi:raffinose/stachyose/melibiose transport system permease protein
MTTALYVVFLLGIIIPWELGLIPIYIAMRHLHLIGSYIGMIVFYTGLFMPLTVFLYTGFVRALPRDYEEAAQVDGATQRRVFFRVVLPLLLPVTATVAVLDGLFIWNNFFTQLIFLSGTNKTTLPVAVYSLANASLAQWNVIFAAVAIAIGPVIAFFLFAQRTMIRGFSGGVRG